MNSVEINSSFRTFYESIYRSEYPDNAQLQSEFLDQLDIPTMMDQDKTELDKHLTVEEMSEVVRSMRSGKTPGADRIPIEIYKLFPNKLLPPLLEMFEEACELGSLPPSLRSVLITLVLKPGKPPTERGSYRPLSLMCCDMKILCKALARRLERYVPSLISNDQNGFVLGRQAFHNIHRVLNIFYEKYDTKDTTILSLDAVKAFDGIEWKCLMEVLARFGIGENYRKWIKLLYLDPTAKILTNNLISQPFSLHRGTGQGCPLSPLLFLFAIEPLALAIRQHPKILGIKIEESQHIILLFADDIIIYLSNLTTSIPTLVSFIESFGKFSGYKVNNSKSTILFLNKQERQNPEILTPFSATEGGFTYLGVQIVPEIENIVSLKL